MAIARKKNTHSDKREHLYELTTLVAGDFSLREVLDRLAKAAVKITGVKACSIRLLDPEAGELKMRSTYGLSEQYRKKGDVSIHDAVVKAAFAGEAVVLDDMRTDERVQYKDAARREGIVSQLTVGMKFKQRPVGVLRLYSPKRKKFGQDEIDLARAVASQCAVAITNAKLFSKAIEGRKMADQMRLAGAVQRRMIPEKAPELLGMDIAAKYIPCFDVGGDFYDFLRISDDTVIIGIADVIGKGIPAALMMSMFRGSMRAYADSYKESVAINSIIDKLNRNACAECRDGEFVTLFFAVINITKKTMTYCNCGHEPTILIRDGKFRELNEGGLVLGIESEANYINETIRLKENDRLVFYTDGLIDAANFQNELWGKQRLLANLKKFAGYSARRTIENLLGYRRRFVGLAKQSDDTSLVIVDVNKDET